jgi:hypothetical protein
MESLLDFKRVSENPIDYPQVEMLTQQTANKIYIIFSKALLQPHFS